MIFASVGTNQLPFNRLAKAMDDLAEKNEDEVIIQIGHSKYKPKFAKYFEFCDSGKMLQLIKAAHVVIAQAGFGIIGDCIRQNKRLILIPREFQFGEAVDNQVELAEYLAERVKGIVCVRDVSKLGEALKVIKNMTPCYDFKTRIPEIIRDFVKVKVSLA